MTLQTEFIFEAQVTVGPPQTLGATALGTSRVVPITGGSFEGPRLKGRVIPGGADWQLIRPDRVTELEARYLLEAEDGTLIAVVNRGLRHGPEEVMRRLAAGETVDPAHYYFRAAARFDAPTGPHDWLARTIVVASGERQPNLVIVRFYRVL